jgi:hypothetical protein
MIRLHKNASDSLRPAFRFDSFPQADASPRNDQIRAFFGEPQRRRLPNSRRSARDDRYFILQSHISLFFEMVSESLLIPSI